MTTSPLRIALITTDARHWLGQFDATAPNFGTAIQGLLQGFGDLGNVEVHVVSASPSPLKSPDKLAANIWFHHVYVSKYGWGRSFFLGVSWQIRRLIEGLDVDIVHGQGTERDCAVAAILSGKPSVLTIHGNMRVHAKRNKNGHWLYYRIASLLEAICLSRCDGVVAISRYTKDLVKGLSPRTWLLPNAVDRRYFDITPAPPVVPHILFVGSIDERKNPLGLIRACEPLLRAGECTLAIAGQGDQDHPYVKEAFALAKKIPGIEMLGFIGRDELGSQFEKCSLVVLPTFEDNCPMVILEAMAAGLPVAASRVGGVPDLITHESNGLMFDPHDQQDMRACLERLVRSPETLARFGQQARIKAHAQFHPKVIAEEHLKIFRDVLGRQKF